MATSRLRAIKKRLTVGGIALLAAAVIWGAIKTAAIDLLKAPATFLLRSAASRAQAIAEGFWLFLSQPIELPSGFCLLILVLGAILAFLVIIGNLWIAIAGPKQSQYTSDEFLGYRWTWRWGARLKVVPPRREINHLKAFCLEPGCDGTIDCRVLAQHAAWAQQGIGYSAPHMKCLKCNRNDQLTNFSSPDPCILIKETVQTHILEKIRSGEWKNVVRQSRTASNRINLLMPPLFAQWFGR
jgi:hypothetical protein